MPTPSTSAPSWWVEIAFDGLQTSPRYPGGLALRFARVLRYAPTSGPRGRHHPDGRATPHQVDLQNDSRPSRYILLLDNEIYRG